VGIIIGMILTGIFTKQRISIRSKLY